MKNEQNERNGPMEATENQTFENQKHWKLASFMSGYQVAPTFENQTF